MSTEATELIRESGRGAGGGYRTEDGVSGEIRADLTVACDGRWSIARQQTDLRPKELPVPIDAWWTMRPKGLTASHFRVPSPYSTRIFASVW